MNRRRGKFAYIQGVCLYWSREKADAELSEVHIVVSLAKGTANIVVKIKEERYSRVPRISDTRYSSKGTKGKWRYASSKARLRCATYRR